MTKENLGRLVLDAQEAMYRAARSILKNDEDCADAIQEAIVKAFAKRETIREEAYARTWLIRIVINECMDIFRKRAKLLPFPEEGIPEAAALESDYSDLYEAIDRLSPEERLTLGLYYREGYSTKEIAGMTGLSESAVKSRLSRARKRLKAYLGGKKAEGKENGWTKKR